MRFFIPFLLIISVVFGFPTGDQECTKNSDCPPDKFCLNLKCSDLCLRACGSFAECIIANNSQSCKCPPEYEDGDPFVSCKINNCELNHECPNALACIDRKCQDPCKGSCGKGAECYAINHSPICTCPSGEGDPFGVCVELKECNVNADCPSDKACEDKKCLNPCLGVCGSGAKCTVIDHNSICSCYSGLKGNPFVSCTADDCKLDSDCPNTLACINLKCLNPCIGVCGAGAECEVLNRKPVCKCQSGEGDPFVICKEVEKQCVLHADCPSEFACINKMCSNPCVPNPCGEEAECNVSKHNPVCKCPSDLKGDPFISCKRAKRTTYNNPCIPSPCGEGADCSLVYDNNALCKCKEGYTGLPPVCKKE